MKSSLVFWLCWAFVAALTILQLQRTGAALLPRCAGFSLGGFSYGRGQAVGGTDFMSSGTWAQYLRLADSRAQAQ